MTATAGAPFGVSTTSDGRWAFVDESGSSSHLAVFSLATATPRLVRTIRLPSGAFGNAVTRDGRYLLIADARRGATVVSVERAEKGEPGAVLGTVEAPAPRPHSAQPRLLAAGAIEVNSTDDGRFAFVSVEYGDEVAVYDLQTAIADHFAHSGYVGSVPLGQAVVGSALSPNGRFLYVTSELRAGSRNLSVPGTLSVISVARARTDPAHSVISTVSAGCQPVRVVVSADGHTVGSRPGRATRCSPSQPPGCWAPRRWHCVPQFASARLPSA